MHGQQIQKIKGFITERDGFNTIEQICSGYFQWHDDFITRINGMGPRAFRILCHVKQTTASSPDLVARQNKWLTVTMSNS
ncbi:hypothetical protein ACFFJN_17050, partial [Erwinia mallotivora]|uniref:hypothetical protein n=1 Tax=Erwinia mallotivora TaxID=69222 RepID=UPI0035F06E1E